MFSTIVMILLSFPFTASLSVIITNYILHYNSDFVQKSFLKKEKKFTFSGKVQKIDDKGEQFYGIKTNNLNFYPLNWKEYLLDTHVGNNVNFKAIQTDSILPIVWGIPIKLLSVSKLSDIVNSYQKIIGDLTATFNEDTTANGTISISNTFGDSTFEITTQATNGTASINLTSGKWTYIPNPNFHGSDQFTITVTDSDCSTKTQVINLTITPVNDASVITGNLYGVATQNNPSNGTIAVTDPDGEPTFAITTQATNGTATIVKDTGVWNYTPNNDFFGTDQFTVTIVDPDNFTATQIVKLATTSTNAAPPVTDGITGSGPEDNNINDMIIINNPNLSLQFTILEQGTNGTATIDQVSGLWIYTPKENYHGTDQFTIAINDPNNFTTTQVVSLTVTSVNDVPTISGDITGTGTEDNNITGTLNVVDPDGAVTFSVSGTATSGTATIDNTGSWTYVPNTNFHGTDQFTITITDVDNFTATQVVNLTVTSVDDPPTITGDITGIGAEDTNITGTISVTDVEGATTFSVSTVPTSGTAVIDASGAWTYTPNANFHGTDQFIITLTDAANFTTTQNINITVTSVDDAPTITGDVSGSAPEDTNVTGTLTVSDPDGNVTFDILSQTSNGKASISSTGVWTYIPNANYHGTDQFTIIITDVDHFTTTQVVNVTTTSVNDPPTISGDVSGSAPEDNDITGTLTVSDPDGTVTFSITSAATSGTATINTNGAWTYTPNANYHGTDQFTITITDADNFTTTQVITLTVTSVDDAPVITGDISGIDAQNNVINGTINVTDNDGAVTLAITTNPVSGTATLDNNGVWIYTPNTDFHGTDKFTVTITDAENFTATQDINLAVTLTTNAPTVNGDVSGTGVEDTNITGTITLSDSNLTPTYNIITPTSNGTVSIDNNGVWTFVPKTNFHGSNQFTIGITDTNFTITQNVTLTTTSVDDSPIVTGDISGTAIINNNITGTIKATDVDGVVSYSVSTNSLYGTATIDANSGVWNYTPNTGFYGSDKFTVTFTDAENFTATQIITLSVTSAGSPTISGDISGTGLEDNNITGTITITDAIGTETIAITSQTTNGTISIDNNNLWTYIPNTNYHGTDKFTITLTNADTTVTTQDVILTVTSVNDPATVTGDFSGVNTQNNNITGIISVSDTDGLLGYAVSTNATSGTAVIDNVSGSWTYTPNTDFFGSDEFIVTITDNDNFTTTQIVNVFVTSTQVSPSITGDLSSTILEDNNATGTILVSGNNTSTFSVIKQPVNGTATINSDGMWTFVPHTNYHGIDQFTVTISDTNFAVSQNINLTVTSVNDSPTITGDITKTGLEDTNITGTINVVDPDGVTSFTITTNATNGTATIDANGKWSYTPNANYHGTDSFTITLTDAQSFTTTQVVSLTITSVDDPPVINGDLTGTGNEDTNITGTLNVTDTDGAVTYSVSTQATSGTATIDTNGAWSYTPNANFNGTDTFTVTLTDVDNFTTTQDITLTVTPVADGLTISGDVSGISNEDNNVTGLLSVVDPDGAVSLAITTDPINGTATINNNGEWTYTPNANFHGIDQFTVTITDSDNISITQFINVAVLSVDDPPTITGDISGTGTVNNNVTGTLNVTDPDGAVSYSVTTQATSGTATIDANGAWTYVPNTDFTGTDEFTVTLTDAENFTATQVISLTIA